MQDAIDPNDIYTEEGDNTYGLEDEPHTTLLFGFHNDVDPDEVLELCKSFQYSDLVLHNPSCFNNEKYDVLKFDVNGPALHHANSKLREKYKNRFTNSYPDYHPHCTIGYIKKEKGQRYADLFKNITYTVSPEKIVYSMPSGEKKQVML
jgi:2'-5' RNA ligase